MTLEWKLVTFFASFYPHLGSLGPLGDIDGVAMSAIDNWVVEEVEGILYTSPYSHTSSRAPRFVSPPPHPHDVQTYD